MGGLQLGKDNTARDTRNMGGLNAAPGAPPLPTPLHGYTRLQKLLLCTRLGEDFDAPVKNITHLAHTIQYHIYDPPATGS